MSMGGSVHKRSACGWTARIKLIQTKRQTWELLQRPATRQGASGFAEGICCVTHCCGKVGDVRSSFPKCAAGHGLQSPTAQSEVNLSLIKSARGESAASKTCSIRERGNLRCKPSSGGKQYKPCAVTRVNAGGRAKPFLKAGQGQIRNCLQRLKAAATPLRSTSLLQKRILAGKVRT